ncbi:hypothetical protein ACIOJE_00935 [Kitasatospora sp. NPDC087861]|uniref:hypothetical protein n=1 Tax=Kitasatospora sp. NPDC087861 TaxID=3364070 RepID=UPI00381CE236
MAFEKGQRVKLSKDLEIVPSSIVTSVDSFQTGDGLGETSRSSARIGSRVLLAAGARGVVTWVKEIRSAAVRAKSKAGS